MLKTLKSPLKTHPRVRRCNAVKTKPYDDYRMTKVSIKRLCEGVKSYRGFCKMGRGNHERKYLYSLGVWCYILR